MAELLNALTSQRSLTVFIRLATENSALDFWNVMAKISSDTQHQRC
ncbi:MAG: hypothetical protein ACTS73_01755 [Arsenophonus sp. NEOnobi-MAG3]